MNTEHYDIIRSGVDKWNAWRLENPDVRPDLRFAVLWNVNLRFADLTGTNLRCAALRCADLTGADLTGANLEETDLRGANLEGAIIAKGWVITKQEET